ncbi:unnamed protein product [Calypogeia fissa]
MAPTRSNRNVCTSYDYLLFVEYMEDRGNYDKLLGVGRKTIVGVTLKDFEVPLDSHDNMSTPALACDQADLHNNDNPLTKGEEPHRSPTPDWMKEFAGEQEGFSLENEEQASMEGDSPIAMDQQGRTSAMPGVERQGQPLATSKGQQQQGRLSPPPATHEKQGEPCPRSTPTSARAPQTQTTNTQTRKTTASTKENPEKQKSGLTKTNQDNKKGANNSKLQAQSSKCNFRQ